LGLHWGRSVALRAWARAHIRLRLVSLRRAKVFDLLFVELRCALEVVKHVVDLLALLHLALGHHLSRAGVWASITPGQSCTSTCDRVAIIHVPLQAVIVVIDQVRLRGVQGSRCRRLFLIFRRVRTDGQAHAIADPVTRRGHVRNELDDFLSWCHLRRRLVQVCTLHHFQRVLLLLYNLVFGQLLDLRIALANVGPAWAATEASSWVSCICSAHTLRVGSA